MEINGLAATVINEDELISTQISDAFQTTTAACVCMCGVNTECSDNEMRGDDCLLRTLHGEGALIRFTLSFKVRFYNK